MKEKLNVMIPVDFSPVSFKALEFLGLLLDRTPIEAHLVHVIQINEADWGGTSESSETIDRGAMQALEERAAQQFRDLRQQVAIPFTSAILHGGLTTTLAQYASRNPVDLVLMGTAGSDGWLEKISGSEAQQVVRHTDVPVLTIHQHASITPIRHMLWVADFDAEKQPLRAVNTLKTLQQLFDAQVHLLHILQKEDDARAGQIRQRMQQFADTLQLRNYELHLRRDYKVPEGVRNFNRETEMDLVIIGTHGRTGIAHLFYGSIAETLVNHCIRPLLTYHLK